MNKPIISLIAAMANNRVIGKDNAMPWHLPADLAHFKAVTLGKPIVMGRKTYESLVCPLPGRTNIVVTRQTDYQAPGCIIAQDLDGAINACPDSESEAFIIGGGLLYHEALALADRIYLTLIPREILGDTFFPEIPVDEFDITTSEFIDGLEPYHFYIYQRTSKNS